MSRVREAFSKLGPDRLSPAEWTELQDRAFALAPFDLGRPEPSETFPDFPGIEKTPNVCGGSACVIRTRIAVWMLIGYRRLGLSDEALLDCYPSLRPSDLAQAWAYAAAHPDEIDREIRENDEA